MLVAITPRHPHRQSTGIYVSYIVSRGMSFTERWELIWWIFRIVLARSFIFTIPIFVCRRLKRTRLSRRLIKGMDKDRCTKQTVILCPFLSHYLYRSYTLPKKSGDLFTFRPRDKSPIGVPSSCIVSSINSLRHVNINRSGLAFEKNDSLFVTLFHSF